MAIFGNIVNIAIVSALAELVQCSKEPLSAMRKVDIRRFGKQPDLFIAADFQKSLQ
jgi:hypothetical protein